MPLQQPPNHLSKQAVCKFLEDEGYIRRSLKGFIENHPKDTSKMREFYEGVEAFEELAQMFNSGSVISTRVEDIYNNSIF